MFKAYRSVKFVGMVVDVVYKATLVIALAGGFGHPATTSLGSAMKAEINQYKR